MSDLPFEASVQINGDAAVINLTGRLDSTTSPEFEAAVNEAAAKEPKRFIMEMSKVGFMSSAALRVIIILIKEGQASGAEVVAAGASSDVLEIFRISGFQKMIKTTPTLEEALA
ncbi:MAG: anti-anti-sigma factor [Verrucomicrobiales bacterium]|jgi:anti-anti-sigma factor